jgi:hypothetical protein
MRRVLASLPLWMLAGACTLMELPEAGTGGASGGGGLQPDVECTADDECTPTGTDCIVRECASGTCAYTPETELTPIQSQKAGDCRQTLCDGAGNETSVNIVDPFDDNNACTVDICADGVVGHEIMAGERCPEGRCTIDGECVQCLDHADCGAQSCQQGMCVPASCLNDALDGDETDVDCGGASCAPCSADKICLVPTDCVSGVCEPPDIGDGNVCMAATCEDNVLNQNESAVDCGGACGGCPATSACNAHEDCISEVCDGNVCQPPRCIDGVTNGDETDIDCGGPGCDGCATGEACLEPRDCASSVCTNGKCVAPTCGDGVKNGKETKVDCGGADCLPCKVGQQQQIPNQP